MGAPVWPAEHDRKIREIAGEVGDTTAIDVLDKLKDILGDVSKVEQYSDVWAPDTTASLTDAQNDFARCVSRVNDVWQGPAADEFKSWALKYNASLIEFKTVTDAMRAGLRDCSRTITDVYKDAIELVAMIAAQLVKLTTGILGAFPDPFDVVNVVGGVLGAFIERAGQIIGNGLKRMQEFRSIVSTLRSKVAGLADLVPMGHMVGETGNWEVRPAG